MPAVGAPQLSIAPLAIQVRTRLISSVVSAPVGGMREPQGGVSVSFRYKRLMSGFPATTNDKPELAHCDPLAGLSSSELRTALAVPALRLKLPPVEVPV